MNKAIVEELFSQAGALPYDGSGMARVSEMRGPGFFPGCNGLNRDFTTENSSPVMVLGQDFGTQDYYNKVHKEDGEVKMSTTWRNLIPLLVALDISPEACFFTNTFMGLREDGKMTGPCNPALNPNSPFSEACKNFLMAQIEAILPELVLVLGTYPARTLAAWWPEDFSDWTALKGVTRPLAENRFYDGLTKPFYDVRFGDKDVRFVFALHPSMSNTHRGLIWGKNGDGGAHEIAHLKAFMPMSLSGSGS